MLINLEMDKLDIAISAGKFLCEGIRKQPDLKNGFYLRLDKQENIITEYLKDQIVFHFVSVKCTFKYL